MFFGLSALLFVQAAPVSAQQIPASELPLPGLIPVSMANMIRKMESRNWCAAKPKARNNISGRTCARVHAAG